MPDPIPTVDGTATAQPPAHSVISSQPTETSTVDAAGATVDAPAPAAHRARRRRPDPADLIALGTFLLGALYLMVRLWIHPTTRIAAQGTGDRVFAEWNLAMAARAIAHLDNPLFSTAMNAPLGINTMANTSMLGLGIPVAPITLLFGPAVSFDLLIVLALAGTAFAWYYVLSRHVVSSRAAAWIGGLFAGFAPSMTAHANLHPNLVAQFAVPLIAWRVMALRASKRTVRDGLILGALIAYQAFLN